ncbi:MAG: hypothetical protein JWN86_1333 [Planctomycetota bacterium]|nr:hypothetical protein [Planctomycetota bacterium]
MDSMQGAADRETFRRHVRSADFQTIQVIAEAMRSEFGEEIDAHPGGPGVRAGAMNRALRIAAWVILKEAGSLEDDEADVQMAVLRQVALGRLHELGLFGPPAEVLVASEPNLYDAWLAYMALAPSSVIDDLIGRTPGG